MYLTVQTIKQIVLIHENAKVIIDSEDVWCEIVVAQASSDGLSAAVTVQSESVVCFSSAGSICTHIYM